MNKLKTITLATSLALLACSAGVPGSPGLPSLEGSGPATDTGLPAGPDSVAPISAPPAQWLVTTVAGNGAPFADGFGSEARLFTPSGAASDGLGNVYVADTSNHVIRKFNNATGELTTIAGVPMTGGNVDGILGIGRLNGPTGIAYAGANTLYVTDSGSGTVKKIELATGRITTIVNVGHQPVDIAFDFNNTLYVSLPTSYRVVKVDIAAKTVSPFIGEYSGLPADGVGTAATLNSPHGLAYDGVNTLYVADFSTVRSVNTSTALVTTIIGGVDTGSVDGVGSAARINGAGGICFDGIDTIFIAETGLSKIRKLVISTQTLSTVAGGSGVGAKDGPSAQASFYYPTGVAKAASGTFIVTDNAWGTLRKFHVPSDTVTTVAGVAHYSSGIGAAAKFWNPQGIATAPNGDIFISDSGNGMIQKLNPETRQVSPLAGQPGFGYFDGEGAAARFNYAKGITTDNAGNLYVADTDNNLIRKINIATHNVTTLAGSVTQGIADGAAASARFYKPWDIAYDGNGHLFVADAFNSTIRIIELATNQVYTFAGWPGDVTVADGIGLNARFAYPKTIEYCGNGYLYVADSGSKSTIRRIEISTGIVSTIAGDVSRLSGSGDGIGVAARFGQITGLACDSVGNLFVTEGFDKVVRKIVMATAEVSTIAGSLWSSGITDGSGSVARFRNPTSITADALGRLFITDAGSGTIRKLLAP